MNKKMFKLKIGDEVGWTEKTSFNPASEVDLEGVVLKVRKNKIRIKIIRGGDTIVERELKYLEKINNKTEKERNEEWKDFTKKGKIGK